MCAAHYSRDPTWSHSLRTGKEWVSTVTLLQLVSEVLVSVWLCIATSLLSSLILNFFHRILCSQRISELFLLKNWKKYFRKKQANRSTVILNQKVSDLLKRNVFSYFQEFWIANSSLLDVVLTHCRNTSYTHSFILNSSYNRFLEKLLEHYSFVGSQK